MREIKFRAWDDTLYKMWNPLTLKEIAKGDFGSTNWYQLHIMQYTGLMDLNGKEIYEGDVVEVWQERATEKGRAVVEFGNPNSEYNWGFQLHFTKDFKLNPAILLWVEMEDVGVYCKVVGNIYDNPELLGGD